MINVDLLVTDQVILCFGAGHYGLVSVRIQINHTSLNTYTPSLGIPTCDHLVHIQKRDNSACVCIVYVHCYSHWLTLPLTLQ